MNEEEWIAHLKKVNADFAGADFRLRITVVLLVICATALVATKLLGY